MGLIFPLLDAFSGGSPDWVRGVLRIKHAYSVELRDLGRYGFLLPPSYITPTGRELMAGIMVIAQHTAAEYGGNLARNIRSTTELEPQKFIRRNLDLLRCRLDYIG